MHFLSRGPKILYLLHRLQLNEINYKGRPINRLLSRHIFLLGGTSPQSLEIPPQVVLARSIGT